MSGWYRISDKTLCHNPNLSSSSRVPHKGTKARANILVRSGVFCALRQAEDGMHIEACLHRNALLSRRPSSIRILPTLETRYGSPPRRPTESIMKHALSALVLILLAGFALTAAAQGAPEVTRAQVDELLAGFESVPTPAEWQALGEDGALVLRAIASDSSTLATRRARAVVGLGHFPGPESVATFRTLLADEKAPTVVRRKAIAMLGQTDPDALVLLAPLVSHEDVQIRISAVITIGRLQTSEARAILSARLPAEQVEHVQFLITDVLEQKPIK